MYSVHSSRTNSAAMTIMRIVLSNRNPGKPVSGENLLLRTNGRDPALQKVDSELLLLCVVTVVLIIAGCVRAISLRLNIFITYRIIKGDLCVSYSSLSR